MKPCPGECGAFVTTARPDFERFLEPWPIYDNSEGPYCGGCDYTLWLEDAALIKGSVETLEDARGDAQFMTPMGA